LVKELIPKIETERIRTDNDLLFIVSDQSLVRFISFVCNQYLYSPTSFRWFSTISYSNENILRFAHKRAKWRKCALLSTIYDAPYTSKFYEFVL